MTDAIEITQEMIDVGADVIVERDDCSIYTARSLAEDVFAAMAKLQKTAIEITPAQIEAGVAPLLTFVLGTDDPYAKVREILMVVLGAAPAPSDELPPLTPITQPAYQQACQDAAG